MLVDKCKGNRVKFESMKRRLTKLGRCQPNPDMESDTEGNLQFKPLTHDQESSHSEDEMVSQNYGNGERIGKQRLFQKADRITGLEISDKDTKGRSRQGEEG